MRCARRPHRRRCIPRILYQNFPVLWLTPLFPVDYTRLIARPYAAQIALEVNQPRGFSPPGSSQRCKRRETENMRGRLGQDEPLGSVERVSLQQRIDRWVSRTLARLMQRLLARAFRTARPAPVGFSPEARSAVPLHRDPWCGTYISPEISFPLEHSGQVLHFCSAECRSRYQRSSQRAASA